MGTTTRTPYVANTRITAAALNANETNMLNVINGNIENVNVKSNAAIAASKLNLSSIAQAMVMSASILKTAKGADVASAGTMTLGDDGNFFDITGTTTITSITAKTAGTIVVLQFDGALTLTDGSNLKLNGSMTTAAESTITLVSDGTNWFEISRSPTSAAASRPYFRAYRNTSAQAISNATPTKMQFNAETFDSGTVFDSATNFRFTPAVSGKYQLNASVQFNSAEDQQLFEIFIYKNDASIAQNSVKASGTAAHQVQVSDIVDSDTNDYFEVFVSQTNGATEARDASNGSTVTFFSGCKVD